ncbi:threonine/serine exporter family protein [Bradyrhizobium sp. SRL28]|uniref:threonine/serine exporter family protein n=2 Tax=unclassified Bradyrhizobium TaxID=2631580 RepID=UPI001BDE90D9|nr:threonine/serine exporter family protein [Bradyrhizobium sp. SRL28]MBT1514067.1 threonine/serine exporter family protein [Bradyrhizobium sp. SRL28]
MPLTREAVLDAVALAAALLFAHGQTTERIVIAAERLGRALGVPVTALPYWGQLTVEIDGTTLSQIVPVKPLGVDMGKVLAVTTVVDQVCDGKLEAGAVRSALAAAGHLPSVSTLRFTLLAAVGAASLGVIFGAVDAISLLLIAASAAIGALARRSLSGFSSNPLIQPLCAATIAGAVAGAAGRLQLSEAITLIAFCHCMVLVPGPHLLNGAIDLARTRIALGIARLAYANVVVLMICAGLWFGLVVTGATLPAGGSSAPTPLVADVIAAGCAVAAFGTFFSMPWRLLPVPIGVGMLAHAVRWAAISMASANVATGAFVACIVVSVIVTPVADRLHLPFAAVGFSAVVSMMPGFFLFHAASGLVELVSIGPRAPAVLLTSVAVNGATAFLVILAMTLGLILPRMLYEHFLPGPE